MCLKSSPFKVILFALVLFWNAHAFSDNQTSTVSPIFPGDELPFQIRIELLNDHDGTPFLLPNGLQTYSFATHGGKWLLFNGRTNGLHGFNRGDNPSNFPPSAQNRTIYVVDPKKRKVYSRSLDDARSGLTQDQIDSLSVVATQFYQRGSTLYVTGGYGFRNATNAYETFDILSAIDVPGLMHWVTHPTSRKKAAQSIRQISDPTFRVTGGGMFQLAEDHPTLLIFGNDFEGAYSSGTSTQIYTNQVRRFHIHDDGVHLSAEILAPSYSDGSFRRRDLNVVPVISMNPHHRKIQYETVALSGVFTVSTGIWTVPVTITPDGEPFMANPAGQCTFKQGMNNYQSAFMSAYSMKTRKMYVVLFGGISYEFFQNGAFAQDPGFPFINQVTTIKIDKCGFFKQYLMDAEYPVILSTQSNPGNPLLFGAGAHFIPASKKDEFQYRDRIVNIDRNRKNGVVGYIIGGIQSTLPNTDFSSDSAASPYIFKVILECTGVETAANE